MTVELDATLNALDAALDELGGTPEAVLISRAFRILAADLDATQRRVRTLEASVARPKKATVFEIPVEFVGDTTAEAVRAFVAELPRGLSPEEVVAKLDDAGLARKAPER